MGTVNGSYPIPFLKKMKRIDREKKREIKERREREKGKGKGERDFSFC